MDLVKRMLLEKSIGFIPTQPDPFTMDNCATCGKPLDSEELKKKFPICFKCAKMLSETAYVATD